MPFKQFVFQLFGPSVRVFFRKEVIRHQELRHMKVDFATAWQDGFMHAIFGLRANLFVILAIVL